MKKLVRLLKNVLIWHLSDSTAMATFANPVFTAVEKLAGMPNAVSIKARIFGTILAYFGVATVISRGRDYSKKIFKITNKTSGSRQSFHDAIYLAIFHLLWQPIFYFIGGSRNIEKIALGTLGSIIYGLFSGAPLGFIIDVFRDLLGLQECDRRLYPTFVKSQGSFAKIAIVIALVGSSVSIMTLIYLLAAS